MNIPAVKEITGEELQSMLNSVPTVKSDFNMIITSLRRRQLAGSYQCAKATIEIIRSLLGRYNFTSGEHMMSLVRAVGRELMSAAQSELTIGNLVRRVLFFIREEYANQIKLESNAIIGNNNSGSGLMSPSSGSNSPGSIVPSVTADNEQLQHPHPHHSIIDGSIESSAKRIERLTLSSTSSASTSNNRIEPFRSQFSDGFAISIGGQWSSVDNFKRHFPGLKSSVIGSINELYNEIDNTTVICQRAQDYIHADECILTYGYSRIIEQFFKAAGIKRKFQLIIAESSPSMDGHKLAHALSKVPSISITLIPDSNIYALMARVNKVILSPHAVMADGGAICSCGVLMVSVAAKEFSVPLVCVSGAFALTPLFAHNQTSVINQLLSPSAAMTYNANVNINNVEVNYPAFDYLSPDLVSLYVTNDGNPVPSYVFRQLSEYYHPHDYNL